MIGGHNKRKQVYTCRRVDGSVDLDCDTLPALGTETMQKPGCACYCSLVSPGYMQCPLGTLMHTCGVYKLLRLLRQPD